MRVTAHGWRGKRAAEAHLSEVPGGGAEAEESMSKHVNNQERKMTKKKTVKKSNRNVIVEIPLPDGWLSMYSGRLVRHTASKIVITDAAWIASTGRRNEFFAGRPDDKCEIEPYPDGVQMSLPAAGAVVTDWPHALPREAR